MMRIHEELQDGRATNCSKLARKLEVSTKTVMRDLAFMRDQLDLPVEYDARTYAWRYTCPVTSFPTVQVTEGELLALLVARRALEQFKGTPYHDQLAHAFAKLSAGLNDRISFSPAGGLQSVSFHRPGISQADLRLFEKLSQAVLHSREITFTYRKLPGAATEERRLQPYHLANRENAWYLIGRDLQRQALRMFAVARILGLTVSTRTFERPADFSAEKHFGKSFGAFVGHGDHRVVIRFTAAASERIKERFWHESQVARNLPDGTVELSFHLDSLDEIQRWILGWGPDARVIEPRELAARVRTTAAATARRYPR